MVVHYKRNVAIYHHKNSDIAGHLNTSPKQCFGAYAVHRYPFSFSYSIYHAKTYLKGNASMHCKNKDNWSITGT